eukprot:11581783-Prorocentrum_lima.AAC.1
MQYGHTRSTGYHADITPQLLGLLQIRAATGDTPATCLEGLQALDALLDATRPGDIMRQVREEAWGYSQTAVSEARQGEWGG